jgi:hypothetical protein
MVAGKEAFARKLGDDTAFWASCEARWGVGSGRYRDDIATRSRDWVVDAERKADREMVVRLITEGWAQLVEGLKKTVSDVSSARA